MKVWIYLESREVFKQVDRDDKRLEWANEHAPAGLVRYYTRLSADPRYQKWEYCWYGETREGAAAHKNKHWTDLIEKAKQQIREYEKRLVKP